MANTWNLSGAKAQLSALIDQALRGVPQRIERRGEAVVVVAAPVYDKLAKPKRSLLELFAQHPEIEIEFDAERTGDDREVVDL